MKTIVLSCLAPGAIILATTPVVAQSPPSEITRAAQNLESPRADSPNRFGASFRMAFNASVKFKNLGGYAELSNPRRTLDPSRNDHYNFDDGYVLEDSTGNEGRFGLPSATWYWSYDNPGQVVPNRDNPQFVVMHRSSSPATVTSEDREDDPSLGFELTYARELGRSGRWRWGMEFGFGYLDVSARDADALGADVSTTPYRFAVPPESSGQPLPEPGIPGTFLGPGPIISDQGTRLDTIVTHGAALITGNRSFGADVFGFKLGPYAEIPLGANVTLSVGGGLALVQVSSEFKFDETVSFPGANGPVTRSGSGTHDDLLVGGYVAGSVSYALDKDWDLFGGVQFQDAGKYSHTVNGKTAVLDLSRTIFVSLGVNYSF